MARPVSHIGKRLFLNFDAVAGRHDLGDDLVVDQQHSSKTARNGAWPGPASQILKNRTRDQARSKKKSFQEFALVCNVPLLYMKSANASNAAGAEWNCSSSGAVRIHHLEHGRDTALLRLVLVVDLRRLFRIVR